MPEEHMILYPCSAGVSWIECAGLEAHWVMPGDCIFTPSLLDMDGSRDTAEWANQIWASV